MIWLAALSSVILMLWCYRVVLWGNPLGIKRKKKKKSR